MPERAHDRLVTSKGSLLLVAKSALESRIITSFLEAADYVVTDLTSLSSPDPVTIPEHFDAAVLVPEGGESNLLETCQAIREIARRETIPIILVAPENPSESIDALTVLLRPIRLFDLVHAVDRVLDLTRDHEKQDPQHIHDLKA